MESTNARLGLRFFCAYLVLYAGFVLINTFNTELMESTPVAGINLAILYGFGLIVFALLLALLYGAMCDSGSDTAGTAAGQADGTTNSDATKEDA